MLPGKLATLLPEGIYRFDGPLDDPALACLSWALSAYRFTRYKQGSGDQPRLALSKGLDRARLGRMAQAICMATNDFHRAYHAFVAKQTPVFEGN
jgi:leucyl aminopeptidase